MGQRAGVGQALCLIPHYLFAYGGDERALAEHYDAMRRYVDYLSSRANGSIVDFGLGDWVAPGTKTSVALTSTRTTTPTPASLPEPRSCLAKPRMQERTKSSPRESEPRSTPSSSTPTAVCTLMAGSPR